MLSLEIITVIIIFIVAFALGALVYICGQKTNATEKINKFIYMQADTLLSGNPKYQDKDAFMSEFKKRFSDNINKTSTCILQKFKQSTKKTDNEIANMSDDELNTALSQYLNCCDPDNKMQECTGGQQKCTGQQKCIDMQIAFILMAISMPQCNIEYKDLFDYAKENVVGSDIGIIFVKFLSSKCMSLPPTPAANCDTCAVNFKTAGGCVGTSEKSGVPITDECKTCYNLCGVVNCNRCVDDYVKDGGCRNPSVVPVPSADCMPCQQQAITACQAVLNK
jgi:hypothetical protein